MNHNIKMFYRLPKGISMIHNQEILKMPNFANCEIDQMRQNVIRLARAVCEHVWGRKFY